MGLALFAAGMALAGTPSTTAITEALPPSKQGVASAVNDTARELGSALGIAILGSALNQHTATGSRAPSPACPTRSARRRWAPSPSPSHRQLAAHADRAAPLVAAAKQAFVDGISSALVTAAIVAVLAAVAVFVLAPRRGDERARR